MHDTIYCSLPENYNKDAITKSIYDMESFVQSYVPGYRQISDPQFTDGRIAIFIEVEGAGDFLPRYAGNLDIMTASAVKVGEEIVKFMNEMVEA
jgi:acetaldehyde dehydrogenase